MIHYSWKKINDMFDWNEGSVLAYFYQKELGRIPNSFILAPVKRIKVAAKQEYPAGPCFLINPKELLETGGLCNDLYKYIELASLRNGFDYKYRKMTHLPLALVEEFHLVGIDDNPFLKIENDNIYFKYEQR